MNAREIKEYIYENNKIEFILTCINCHNIKFHSVENKTYYSASRWDGDNPNGVNVSCTEYLSYISYSHNIGFDTKLDIFDLISERFNCGFYDSYIWLCQILNLNPDSDKKANEFVLPFSPLAWLKKYNEIKSRRVLTYEEYNELNKNNTVNYNYPHVRHALWEDENITNSTFNRFEISYDYMHKRIIVPIRDWRTGKVIAYNGRTTIEDYELFGIKKYYISYGYNKSNNLFGLFENHKAIAEYKKVILFESEKSVLKLDAINTMNLKRFSLPFNKNLSIAMQGHTASENQIDILVEFIREVYKIKLNEIIIAFDKDIKEDEIKKTAEKIYSVSKIFNCKVSYILDRKNLLDEKQSPIDKGLKLFFELYNSREVFVK